MEKLKLYVLMLSGGVFTAFGKLLGGFDPPLKLLLFVMIADYVTGMLVAAAKKSLKTESGGLSSKVGFIGLIKKFFILTAVSLCMLIDEATGSDFIRNYAVYAFASNEILSLLENAGLLGIPMPEVLLNAIDILKRGNEHV